MDVEPCRSPDLDVEDSFWEDLEGGKTVALLARGRSMLPLYPSGTRFLLRRAEPGDLAPGDLVLLRSGTRAVLHRLIGFTPGVPMRLLTKGDWLSDGDDPWPLGALCGKAVGVERPGWPRRRPGALGGPLALALARFSPALGRCLGILRRARGTERGPSR